jgi:hypothetical protein
MSTDQPTTTPAGEPAPADVTQGAQTTGTLSTDVSGQSAPAPDTIGVSGDQTSTQGDPTAPGIPDPSAPPVTGVQAADSAATTDVEVGGVAGPVGDPVPATDPAADTTPTPAAEVVTSPPADTTDLPAWAQNETADPVVIRQIEQGTAADRPEEVAPDTTLPAGNEAVTSEGRVLVSPSDPELGPQITRWLERQAARDARLSPLVDRLPYLDNVLLSFESDDPVLARPEEPAAPEPAAA